MIAQIIQGIVTALVVNYREARRRDAQGTPEQARVTPAAKTARPRRPTEQERVRQIKEDGVRLNAERDRLLAECRAKYQALIADGTLLERPEKEWLGNQIVVCTNGHRCSYGAFVYAVGSETKTQYKSVTETTRTSAESSLYETKPILGIPLTGRPTRMEGVVYSDATAERTVLLPETSTEVVYLRGCPTCHTDLHSFEAERLKGYVVCLSTNQWGGPWCYPYRASLGVCPGCRVRREYYGALQALEKGTRS